MAIDLPEHVKPYLDEIAKRLWSNKAAVMVGAGFSRNAEFMSPISKNFPSWRELGDIFFKKLHGRLPNENEKYLNLLKLAEQIEAAFGRSVLDDLLKREIPDRSCEPSSLHSRLLDLPWTDVFTTNYDTLLERARELVILKHYDVVITKDELLYATAPRIIKLHGSFPSPPFVITEEDYRCYADHHAPFVNTVRQSLLENTLCLIGFSGDDPNFLRWIGWIRDNFGLGISPKCYLIAIDKISETDRRLLERRDIVAVDLSISNSFNADSGRALSEFLQYLKDRKPRATDWPILSADAPSKAADNSSCNYTTTVSEWRHQRKEYPGWMVLPENQRSSLWYNTRKYLFNISQMSPEERAQLQTPLDLELAYELTWRLELCLFPLIKDLPAFLEEIITKYSDTTLSFRENANWNRASIFDAIVNIRLCLLRYYREEGLNEKWTVVAKAFEIGFEKLSPEYKARFRMEEALQALFRFDPAEAKQLLVNWQSNDNLPFWEAKRAALMAELGETKSAYSILEKSLYRIRKQLNLKPIIDDYTLISQELIVMLLLQLVERGRGMNLMSKRQEDSELLNEISERSIELARYKFNPISEMESLSAHFSHSKRDRKLESKTHNFDLGTVTTTFHLGPDEEAIAAYGLLRIYEDIGIPYRVEYTTHVSKPVKAILPCVGRYSPHWALTAIVRLGDAKAVDDLFDREYLANCTVEDVDRFFEIYLPAFERMIAITHENDLSKAKCFEQIAKTLPEIFSRLCYKCSPIYREKLMNALRAIYTSKQRRMFKNVGGFSHRLFDSMSMEERIRAIPILIDFPIPDQLTEIESDNFFNPIKMIQIDKSVDSKSIQISEEKIDRLLDDLEHLVSSELVTKWKMTTLVWLYEKIKFNKKQSKRLGIFLWNDVDTPEVPIIPGYYSYVCATLPSPKEIDAELRAKKYLISIIDESSTGDLRDRTLIELRLSTKYLTWSEDEAIALVTKFSEWWNQNKNILLDHSQGMLRMPADKIKQTIKNSIHALSAVFEQISLDKYTDIVGDIDKLREFLIEMNDQDIPIRILEAATIKFFPENRELIFDHIAAAMLSKKEDIVIDALYAAEIIVCSSAKIKNRDDVKFIGRILIDGIRWRHQPALVIRLRIVANLVENQPDFLSGTILSDLLSGLWEIADETSTGVKDNDRDGVIFIRAAAASLAFELYKYYRKSGLDEPEAIRCWRKLCSHPNEFADVKNSWLIVGV